MKNAKKLALTGRDVHHKQSESVSFESKELKIPNNSYSLSRHSAHLSKLIRSYNGQLDILNEQLRLKEEAIEEKNTCLLKVQEELDNRKEATGQMNRELSKPGRSTESSGISDSAQKARSHSDVYKSSCKLPDNKKNTKDNELLIKKRLLENEVELLNSKIKNLNSDKSNHLDEIKQLKQHLAQTKTEKEIIVEEKDKIINNFESEINLRKEKERKYKKSILSKKEKLQDKKKKYSSLKNKIKALKGRESKLISKISVLEKKVEELNNQLLTIDESSQYQEKLKELQASNSYLMAQLIHLKNEQCQNRNDPSDPNALYHKIQREKLNEIKLRLVSVYRKYLTEVRYEQSNYLLTPAQFANIEKEINDLICYVHEKANPINMMDSDESIAPFTSGSICSAQVSTQNSFYKI